ncbi:MAG: divalent-cation tolerance protein CutA [Deltaproteobacteria bacterium]|nr:divalent-cation tolerance protein CutA [Deltaproteobacteria bacterium]
MEIRFVYMTMSDLQEARKIGRALLEKRLVACVNMFNGMQSMYWWDGAIEEDQEVVLIAKTIREKIPELKRTVTSLHSYDCPCIVALPVTEGNQPFFDWIEETVNPISKMS